MSKSLRVSLVLQQLAATIEDTLADAAGERIEFVLVLQADEIAQYISNTERKDGAELIESLLDRWKANRADIPAHYNPDLKEPPRG